MAFRFVHAADIHLDSPLLSLDEYPGAPVEDIRLATRKALGRLVDFSIESEAGFVVIAGDLFDGEWRDCNTGLYFISEMKRLRDAGIMAYIALGNHDAANRMTAGLPWPDHIRFFDHKRAERIPVPGCEAALYSQSFRRQHVDEDLTSSWPLGDSGTFNIGVLHTSANGASGHELYAPCSLDSLRSRHYQYWALGHIHTRTELAREPWVVFPGNIQGRSVRECGPRGCYLVDVDDSGGVSLEFEPLDVVRWQVLPISLDEQTAPGDLEALAESAIEHAVAEAEGRTLAVRIRLEGHGPAWNRAAGDAPGLKSRIRMLAQDSAVPVHIEKLELVSRSPRQADEPDAGPMAELRALIRELGQDDSLIGELQAQFADLKSKLQAVVPPGQEWVDPQDPEVLRVALASVEPLLEGGRK
jgi:DNA repair exonuclease SbcCD nuclease subunit